MSCANATKYNLQTTVQELTGRGKRFYMMIDDNNMAVKIDCIKQVLILTFLIVIIRCSKCLPTQSSLVTIPDVHHLVQRNSDAGADAASAPKPSVHANLSNHISYSLYGNSIKCLLVLFLSEASKHTDSCNSHIVFLIFIFKFYD